MKLKTGLALYSLLAELKEDYLGTLEKVKEMGYEYVEFVATPKNEDGTPVVTPKQIGDKIKELGLVATSSHMGFDENTDIDALIEENVQMGSHALVLPFAMMFTKEQVLNLAALCNKVAKKCKERGLDFYYHNHFQEFVKIDGKYALELFAENTDPDLVKFELDLYWVTRAGIDPVEMMKKLGSRCTMLHQKDLNKDVKTVNLYDTVEGECNQETVMGAMRSATTPNDIVPVGTGCLDVARFCKVGDELGYATHILVELDSVSSMTEENYTTALSPQESVRLSLKNLTEAIG
ncbi:MAG: sugar phosphate isomerase/epimerase family protein [Massiliimalia sp.]|jgi:sugar phosphate isomerase/epimerase